MEQEHIICGKKTLITNENFDHYFEINSIENFDRFHNSSCVKCFFVKINDKGDIGCSNHFDCNAPNDSFYKLKDIHVLKGKKIKLTIK